MGDVEWAEATARTTAIDGAVSVRSGLSRRSSHASLLQQYEHQSHGDRQRSKPEGEQQDATKDDEGSEARPRDDARKRGGS